LLPYTINCFPAVYVQRWFAPPWQSHNCTCVPFVVVEPGTSTQRPDPVPTIMPLDWFGGGLLDADELTGGELGGMLSPNEEMNRHASPFVHVRVPSSQPEQPSTGPGP
jgi:hypothetical protein